jgi:CRISPR-associated endonuclease/helicase Cas3
MAYAHSRNDRGERHDLVAHLRSVGQLAAGYARSFDAQEAAYWLGLWHDVGKFDPKWQEYLLACEADPRGHHGRVDHKAAGTALALGQNLGHLALLIHGHHGGLRRRTDLRSWFDERRRGSGIEAALAAARVTIPDLEPKSEVSLPEFADRSPHAAELFLRLLFSTLIDADRLDTEWHFQRDRTAVRGSDVGIEELWNRFERDQAAVTGRRTDPVGRARHEIYQACLGAAELPPGLFRLTVPTGGGKTRSGMAFALRHALRHGQQRVVVAVPFISITQQTADQYRRIFQDESDDRPVVLEHHSGGETSMDDEEDFALGRVWSRLAAENWDAPIIVTTTVQLFQSLFANATTPVRKVHRLAQSVIILDEAQALPAYLLRPILDVLQELCRHYGTTVVLSTATQPAFEAIPEFAQLNATEIVPAPERYFQALRRVAYEWNLEREQSWDEVAELLHGHPQTLAVLNTKRDALDLFDALGDPGALHLSTLLCGAHRRQVIAEVRRRLSANEPCRLISTQVVEAGVDLDFPVVLRAAGPLDSIIQAAGRCNREGRLAQGRVVVFRPLGDHMPVGPYRIGAQEMRSMVGAGGLDPDDPEVCRRYFARWLNALGAAAMDREGIQPLRASLDFPEVSRRFRMIDDDTVSVVVTQYGADAERADVRRLLDRLRAGTPDARRVLRRLQPYTVAVWRGEAANLERRGFISPVMEGLGEWLGDYDQRKGLVAADLNADILVV